MSDPNDETIFTVALQLIKAEGSTTTFSMSQSWQRGGSKDEALVAAMEHAKTAKPDFAVQQWLISEILPPAPGASL